MRSVLARREREDWRREDASYEQVVDLINVLSGNRPSSSRVTDFSARKKKKQACSRRKSETLRDFKRMAASGF